MLGPGTIRKVNAFFRAKELRDKYVSLYETEPEAWERLLKEYGTPDSYGGFYPLDEYSVPLIDLEDAIETLEREVQP